MLIRPVDKSNIHFILYISNTYIFISVRNPVERVRRVSGQNDRFFQNQILAEIIHNLSSLSAQDPL
jgi:hypothetical protein